MNGNDIFGAWVPIRNHFYGAISMVAPPSLWGPFLWSHVYGLLLSYVHPRKAPRTKEIWRHSCLVASSAATCHMGSVLTIRLYEPGPTWHDDVECVGGNESVWWSGDYFWKVSSRLSHDHATPEWYGRLNSWVLWEKCTNSREDQTKYLAVSPVMDNFEQLDLKQFEKSPHPNFLN